MMGTVKMVQTAPARLAQVMRILYLLVAGSYGSCVEKVHGGGDFCDPVCELADGAADLRMAFCLGIDGIGRSHLPAGCNEGSFGILFHGRTHAKGQKCDAAGSSD